MKSLLVAFMVVSVLAVTWVVAFDIRLVEAGGTIYIRVDGSVDPPTASIERKGSVYAFTDNISINTPLEHGITVEKSNVVVDGAGFTIHGIGGMAGICLSDVGNITIRNVEIKAFWNGIWFENASNNIICRSNITANTGNGIYLESSANNSISDNAIANNGEEGIKLIGSSFNRICRNKIVTNKDLGLQISASSYNNISQNEISDNSDTAIFLWTSSSNNTISWNNIAANGGGIDVTSNNTVFRNSVTNNRRGIYVGGVNNVLRENVMKGNGLGFGVYGGRYNDIDVSNTVDGKPIYYWFDQHDMTVPLDAGYVALANCSNIAVQNLTLKSNYQGISVAYTKNSTITNNCFENNVYGIFVGHSSNIHISENNITANSSFGIWLMCSSNNSISRNQMIRSYIGLYLDSASRNKILENAIEDNNIGVHLFSGTTKNTLLHNNLMNNTSQVEFDWCEHSNFWDNGCEGNYWSNYNGSDLNGDGVGDAPYIIYVNNQDNYPLMNIYWNPGDIDHDLDVDIFDVVGCASAFGSTALDARWNPHCDIAELYGRIDRFDVVTITTNYGEEYAS